MVVVLIEADVLMLLADNNPVSMARDWFHGELTYPLQHCVELVSFREQQSLNWNELTDISCSRATCRDPMRCPYSEEHVTNRVLSAKGALLFTPGSGHAMKKNGLVKLADVPLPVHFVVPLSK
jgi:hypothetical protein